MSATPAPVNSVLTDQPLVALTFDDGPHPANTRRLLDIFARENVKVTFFEIGKNVSQTPELARAVLKAGHEIGNHSFTHPHLDQLEATAIRRELIESQAVIKSATGFSPVVFRAPYLGHGPELWTVLNELGLPSIGGAISTNDWDANTTREMIIERCAAAAPGDIIILHTWPDKTVEAMPEVIRLLKGRGFRFVTVSQMLAAGG